MTDLTVLAGQLRDVVAECNERRICSRGALDRLVAAADVLPTIQAAHDKDLARKAEQEQE